MNSPKLKYALLMLVARAVFAQSPPTTPIVGPIFDSFSNPYTGSITIQSQSKTNTGYAIVGTSRIVYVTNGAIGSLSLVANDQSVPNLTSYQATFANGDVWICIVPTSSTPVAWTAACAPNATPPNVGKSFPVSQIIPCPNGTVIGTVSNITSCVPAPPAPPSSGNWCFVSIAGVMQWAFCSGPYYTTWTSLPASMTWVSLPAPWVALFH